MKKLSLYVFLVLFFIYKSSAFPDNFQYNYVPNNPPIPDNVTYRGLNIDQWKTINKIGDPLNCQKQIYDLQQIKDFHVVTPENCKDNPFCINHALVDNKYVLLSKGVYVLEFPILLSGHKFNDKILIGDQKGEVIIDAKNVLKAIVLNGGSTVANLTIKNALHIGIDFFKLQNLIYRVVVMNTGVLDSSPYKNIYGHGFEQIKSTGENCLVSVESFNGYNKDGPSSVTRNGGNADGFTAKFGAHNITFIDAHAHHNSDDGFDFWKGGKKSEFPSIRVFYSSANFNGKHPTKRDGDGNGYKFGSANYLQKHKGKDKGARLIYGSVACGNKDKGFMRNRSRTKIIALGNDSKRNRKSYVKVSNKKVKDDKNLLRCSMFLN